MIAVEELTKVRRNRLIVDRVSFCAQPGQVTGILGPNGAGKSSTLRMLLALDRPSAGSARICGASYPDLKRPLDKVGALLEGSGAHPSRKVISHLRWMAVSNGIPRSRIMHVLKEVGLEDKAHQRVATLSLGMAQRLGLAGALLGDPEVLILDEPANGLDPGGIRWLRHLVRESANDGRTVLVSSHLMSEMQETIDHVLIMHDGRIVVDEPLVSILESFGSLAEAFFCSTGETEVL